LLKVCCAIRTSDARKPRYGHPHFVLRFKKLLTPATFFSQTLLVSTIHVSTLRGYHQWLIHAYIYICSIIMCFNNSVHFNFELCHWNTLIIEQLWTRCSHYQRAVVIFVVWKTERGRNRRPIVQYGRICFPGSNCLKSVEPVLMQTGRDVRPHPKTNETWTVLRNDSWKP
jgi:hypothetical protein